MLVHRLSSIVHRQRILHLTENRYIPSAAPLAPCLLVSVSPVSLSPCPIFPHLLVLVIRFSHVCPRKKPRRGKPVSPASTAVKPATRSSGDRSWTPIRIPP